MGQDIADIRIPDFTFGINRELPSLDSGWQTFPGHYVLYASSGVFTLEVEDKESQYAKMVLASICPLTSTVIRLKITILRCLKMSIKLKE